MKYKNIHSLSFFRNEETMIESDNINQYNKRVLSNNLIVTMILAFIFQLANIILNLKTPNLGLFDFYILNNTSDMMIENIIGWMLPLFVAYLLGKQFNYYYYSKIPIFVRTNQKIFIMHCAMRSFIIAFIYVLLFYLFSFIFMFAIVLIMNPSIIIGTSITTRIGLLSAYHYFSYPMIYLLFYVFVLSCFGGIFGLIGFAFSLYFKNNIIVLLSPFAVMIPMIFAFEKVPYSLLFNYNNYITLSIASYSNITLFMSIFCILVAISVYICILTIIIYRKSNSDLC